MVRLSKGTRRRSTSARKKVAKRRITLCTEDKSVRCRQSLTPSIKKQLCGRTGASTYPLLESIHMAPRFTKKAFEPHSPEEEKKKLNFLMVSGKFSSNRKSRKRGEKKHSFEWKKRKPKTEALKGHLLE